MLQQLDTLIGFVVVMAVVSLLITIATQMVSTILGLRGKNLADALEVMILKIDPDNNKSFQGASRLLADRILTNPAISDSILSMSKNWPLGWKRATAIRPDELLSILEDIAGISSSIANSRQTEIASLLSMTSAGTASAFDMTKLKALLTTARTAAIAAQAEAQTAAQAVAANATQLIAKANNLVRWSSSLEQLVTEAEAAVKDSKRWPDFLQNLHVKLSAMGMLSAIQDMSAALQATAQTAVSELATLEKWFNSVQDRARQWYGTHMRIVTSLAALLAALVLQLDSIQLLQKISSDPDVRAKLVAQAANLEQNEKSFFEDTTADPQEMHQAVIKVMKDVGLVIDGKLDARPNSLTIAETDVWIRKQYQGIPDTDVDKIVDDYNRILAEKKLGASDDTIATLSKQLNSTGLQLLPNPYPPVFVNHWQLSQFWVIFSGCWSWPLRHLVGILFSAALLSLGAPFWFNTLQSLTNLRPTLANKVDDKPKQTSTP